MKLQQAQALLNELLKVKTELIADKSQLGTALNKYKKSEIFEEVLRILLDLPSFLCKAKLLSMLSIVKNHSSIFSINLSHNIGRLFTQITMMVADGNKSPATLLQALGSLIN